MVRPKTGPAKKEVRPKAGPSDPYPKSGPAKAGPAAPTPTPMLMHWFDCLLLTVLK